MKHLSFTFCMLIIFSTAFSQKFKFGNIPKEHWEINECNFDSAANSLILFDIGNISIKGKEGIDNRDPNCALRREFFAINYDRHIRIKVLKNNMTKTPYLLFNLRSINGENDKLSNLKGVLIKIENGKETKSKIVLDDLRKEIYENGNYLFTLELQDIKAGSIIDIIYNVQTNIFGETPEWNFMNIYPNLYSEINFTIPDFFILQKRCGILNTLTYKSFSQNINYGVSYALTQGVSNSLSAGWKYFSYSYLENHESYSLSEIPASREMNENNSLKYIIEQINFQSVSYKEGTFKRN